MKKFLNEFKEFALRGNVMDCLLYTSIVNISVIILTEAVYM